VDPGDLEQSQQTRLHQGTPARLSDPAIRATMPGMGEKLAAIKRDVAVCTAMQALTLHALAGGPGSAATVVGEGRRLVILSIGFGAGATLLGLAAGVGLGLALTGG
jgi:hypothetical protein